MKKYVVVKVSQTGYVNPDNGDIVIGFQTGGFDTLEAAEYQTLEEVQAAFAWLSKEGLSRLLNGGKVETESWQPQGLVTKAYKLVEITC